MPSSTDDGPWQGRNTKYDDDGEDEDSDYANDGKEDSDYGNNGEDEDSDYGHGEDEDPKLCDNGIKQNRHWVTPIGSLSHS